MISRPGERLLPDRPLSEEPLARISVSLPRNLYRQIRLRALDQDNTLTSLIVRLIREELARDP